MYSSGGSNSSFKKIIFFEEKLVIETYLIGYKLEGEAVLFFVRTDGAISFSGIVDCFCTVENDKVTEILKKNKVDKLDFICCTHPDFDHSNTLLSIIKALIRVNQRFFLLSRRLLYQFLFPVSTNVEIYRFFHTSATSRSVVISWTMRSLLTLFTVIPLLSMATNAAKSIKHRNRRRPNVPGAISSSLPYSLA